VTGAAPTPLRALVLFAAVLLGGCAVQPIDRDVLRAETAPLRMEGPSGMLSAERSRQILESLKARSPDDAVLEKHVAIEEALAGNPLSVGNKVETLEDGQATYRAMLTAIRAARNHVHMEVYIFEGDETGRLFADAMKERVKAGVKVRLIYDAVGSNKTPKEFFQDLAASGVEVVEFSPISAGNALKEGLALQNRDHRKLTIVDGRIAFLGGINISGVYGSIGSASRSARTSDSAAPGSSGGSASSSGGSSGSLSGSGGGKGEAQAEGDVPFEKRPWRDLQIRIEGPVVSDLQRSFVEQWQKWSKQTLDDKGFYPPLKAAGPLIVRVIPSSPGQKGLNALYVGLISAIQYAESRVSITNAYFVPHPQLREALCDAARRGVDVKLVLPGRSDNELVYHAGRSYYGELLESGVKIYERRTRMLHAKSATIDGVWSTVGSTNLDWRSLVYNDELNAVVLGPEFANQIDQVFERDIADSDLLTVESWRSRPLLDRLKEISARSWAHLL
jgi:cardiolipin synthase